jgi:digeranylgeranylglycerophospholipid reductase
MDIRVSRQARSGPTSGGGIYPGLVAAKIAGGVAAAAAMEGDGSAERLREYDRLWRAALGREVEIVMRVNRMLRHLDWDAIRLARLLGYALG